ncbi:hypothetical protein D3C80_1005340 [compost metagenome]
MLQGFVLVTPDPVRYPLEHFRAGLHHQLPQQQGAYHRNEKAGQVHQVHARLFPGFTPGTLGSIIDIGGCYQQQPGVLLDPLNLLGRQLGEHRLCGRIALQFQVRSRVLQALAQGVDECGTLFEADQLGEVLPVANLRQQQRHGAVQARGIVKVAQRLFRVAGQVQYDAMVSALFVT